MNKTDLANTTVWTTEVNNEFGQFYFRLNDGAFPDTGRAGQSVVSIYTQGEDGELEKFDYFITRVHPDHGDFADFRSECLDWCIDLCLKS